MKELGFNDVLQAEGRPPYKAEDLGLISGETIAIDTCTKNNITSYSSPRAHSSQNNGLYNMNEFEYDADVL